MRVLAFLLLMIQAHAQEAPESKVVYQDEASATPDATAAAAESVTDADEELGRAAIHGHHSLAANPAHHGHVVYPPPPLPPFLHHPSGAAAPPSYHHHGGGGYEDVHNPYDKPEKYDSHYQPDKYDPYLKPEKYDSHHQPDKYEPFLTPDKYEPYEKPEKYETYEKPDNYEVYPDTDHYEEHKDYDDDYKNKNEYSHDSEYPVDFVKTAIDKSLRQLEKLLETLYLVQDLVSAPKPKCHKKSDYYDDDSCQPSKWSKCNCLSPATFTDEGRGNCNLGATKMDVKVWCYVENKYGDPKKICPDSKPSKSKPGYYWSRFACIT